MSKNRKDEIVPKDVAENLLEYVKGVRESDVKTGPADESMVANINPISNLIKDTSLQNLGSLDECILDPSMLPVLPSLTETRFRRIWIPDEVLKLQNNPSKLKRMIGMWTRQKFEIGRIIKVLKSRRAGTAEVSAIQVSDASPELMAEVLERFVDKTLGNLVGEIVGFAHKARKVIVSRTRKMLRYARKLGMTIIELPNEFVDDKSRFFMEHTGGGPRKIRGWRWIGAIAIGVVISLVASPVAGVIAGTLVGLAFASVDP